MTKSELRDTEKGVFVIPEGGGERVKGPAVYVEVRKAERHVVICWGGPARRLL